MSDPIRYDFDEYGGCYELSHGDYVLYKDYARLKAEVERLKAVSTIEQRTIQGLQRTPEWSEIARMTAYCRELEAEVERLRKAGDAMGCFVNPIKVAQYLPKPPKEENK